ncbi:MAG: FAD-dependent oxidoreductase [Pseudomonadota bacterium]
MRETNEFEVIVVGSGPGGASAARELTRRGKKVLILEWGSNRPVKGSVFQALSQLGMPGKSLFFAGGPLALVRGVTAGGSSIFYYHTAFEPPLERLKKHGLDISAELDELKAELPIAPLSDKLMGPMARRLNAAARETGLDWRRLPKLLYQDKCRPNCRLCTYGCPHGAKFNARMLVEQAAARGAVLKTGAKVVRFFLENGRVGGVQYLKAGRPETAFAPQVIISAGGLGTPLILRAGGIKNAGRDFFYDPLIAVMGEVVGIRGGREIPMAAGAHRNARAS